MFDQIKDLYNLRKQAAELQKQMSSLFVTGTSRDGTFQVTLNGNHELIKVDISPDINLNQPEIAKNVKEAHDDAVNKLKAELATKFKGML